MVKVETSVNYGDQLLKGLNEAIIAKLKPTWENLLLFWASNFKEFQDFGVSFILNH